MNFEKIKSLYDNESIEKVESQVSHYKNISVYNRKKFIEILFYLERTNRYKESSQFKHATFHQYIKDRWNLLYTTYHNERTAFAAFPEESEKYGVGLVNKIKKECGVGNVKTVFDDISKFKGDKTREQISSVIQKYKKQTKKRVKTRYTISQLEQLLSEKELIIKEQHKEIVEKDKQIEKLKNTIKILRATVHVARSANGDDAVVDGAYV